MSGELIIKTKNSIRNTCMQIGNIFRWGAVHIFYNVEKGNPI